MLFYVSTFIGACLLILFIVSLCLPYPVKYRIVELKNKKFVAQHRKRWYEPWGSVNIDTIKIPTYDEAYKETHVVLPISFK